MKRLIMEQAELERLMECRAALQNIRNNLTEFELSFAVDNVDAAIREVSAAIIFVSRDLADYKPTSRTAA